MKELALITDAAKEIPGYEGLYKVTKHGVVYSMPRRGRRTPKRLKPVDNMKAGYLRVSMSVNGDDDLLYIHRLVALAFIPNPEGKPVVNHRNGIKTDNHVDNLEWMTYQENTDHAFLIGLKPAQKIHSSQKRKIYEMVAEGVPISKVAELYGVTYSGIYNLVKRFRETELRMAA